jgi:hypothetical protein
LTSLFLVITLSAYYNRHNKKMDLDLNLTPQEEDVQQPQEEDVQQPHHRELPDSHRYAVYVALKALGKDRQVTKADKKHVVALLETSLTTVRRIWTAAQEQQRAGKRIVKVDVSSKNKGNCGRKKSELGLSRIPSIELNKRSTLRGLASFVPRRLVLDLFFFPFTAVSRLFLRKISF